MIRCFLHRASVFHTCLTFLTITTFFSWLEKHNETYVADKIVEAHGGKCSKYKDIFLISFFKDLLAVYAHHCLYLLSFHSQCKQKAL